MRKRIERMTVQEVAIRSLILATFSLVISVGCALGVVMFESLK